MSSYAYSQNIVDNPSFEVGQPQCDFTILPYFYPTYVNGWNIPNISTADVFSTQISNKACYSSMPDSGLDTDQLNPRPGSILPRTGNRFAGIFTYIMKEEGREYIQDLMIDRVDLIHLSKADKIYRQHVLHSQKTSLLMLWWSNRMAFNKLSDMIKLLNRKLRYKMKFLSFLLLTMSLTLAINSEAQRIKLTNSKTNKEVILTKGMRVVYVYKTKPGAIGTINEITPTGMSVDGTTVAFEDLKGLGRRKKGAGFGTFVLSFFGGAFIGSVIFADNSDPCPSCQTVSVEDDGAAFGNAMAVVGGVGLIVLAVNTGIKNSPRDLDIWKLEVVD